MRGWAAGLASCAAVLALVVISPHSSGQEKTRKAGAAASRAASASAGPAAVNYAQRFAGLCAACHGANGRSDMPLTPVLAGQPAFYSITQLFLFREGRRSNQAMTAVAKTFTDDDMRGFSEYIGTLPPVPAPPSATAPDKARMDKGLALAQQHKCVFCHGADFSGGQQVPRIAGQREDYLKMSLRGFHDGTRPGYTQAMTAAVSQIPLEDLDTLAYYVARFPAPVPGSK
ncbi:MAG: c-type cytochrome [Ramlibacter sp.]|nr:c-type cytochrome [Ramlibacter sp.]